MNAPFGPLSCADGDIFSRMPDTAGLGDIWIRASRLAERCNLCVHVNALPPGWRVRVELMTDLSVYSEGTGEHLLEAFAAAINRAESMGMVRGKPRGT